MTLRLAIALTFLLAGCGTLTRPAVRAENLGVGDPDGEACDDVEDSRCAAQLTLPSADGAAAPYVTYFRSFDLTTPRPEITRLLIAVHGFKRNAANTFERVEDYADERAHADDTLVVAPWFKTKSDDPGDDELYWTENSWSKGDDALGPSPANGGKISSFDAVDALIDQVVASGAYPKLATVVVAGLSAGGQFTQRYAVGNLIEAKYPALHFRYVVASPSSYLYLDDQRPSALGDGGFATPVVSACLTDYDRYRYGLESLNRYMRRASVPTLRWQYLARDVVYLVGDGDDATDKIVATPDLTDEARRDAADLDVSCGANLQGDSRLERSRLYARYLDRQFRGHNHHQAVVAGVAHQLAIFDSAVGADWLFAPAAAAPAASSAAIVTAH